MEASNLPKASVDSHKYVRTDTETNQRLSGLKVAEDELQLGSGPATL